MGVDFDGASAVELLVSGSVMNTLWVVDDAFTVLGGLDPTSSGVTGYAYGTGECIGDVDGDGTEDVIFCPSDSGYLVTCTVAYGSVAGLVASGRNLVVHTGIYQVAGTGNTSGGDLNGDGVSDFAAMKYGSVYIVLSVQGTGLAGNASTNISDTLYILLHRHPPGPHGRWIRGLVFSNPGNNPGDTNADGYGDFLVGHINARYGSVYLFLGTYNWTPEGVAARAGTGAAETANPPPPCLSTLRV